MKVGLEVVYVLENAACNHIVLANYVFADPLIARVVVYKSVQQLLRRHYGDRKVRVVTRQQHEYKNLKQGEEMKGNVSENLPIHEYVHTHQLCSIE